MQGIARRAPGSADMRAALAALYWSQVWSTDGSGALLLVCCDRMKDVTICVSADVRAVLAALYWSWGGRAYHDRLTGSCRTQCGSSGSRKGACGNVITRLVARRQTPTYGDSQTLV